MLKTREPKFQEFAQHFTASQTPPPDPAEIDQCIALLTEGKLKLHTLTPRGEELDTWEGSKHQACPDALTVCSPSPIDAGFIEAIQQLPGTDLYAAFDYDTECLFISLEEVFKVENNTSSVEIEPFSAEGFSDGFEIVRFDDANELVRQLFFKTIPDDPLFYEYRAQAHPFQALFHGFQVGPCVRLTVAAQERRLSQLSPEHLRGSVDEYESNLSVANEFRDTALHIAARTAEITSLPQDVLDPQSLFQRGNRGKTVMQVACEAGLGQWLQSHLVSRSETDWENVVHISRAESLGEELPQFILSIPQMQKVIQEHIYC
jgi:hypothetical protein